MRIAFLFVMIIILLFSPAVLAEPNPASFLYGTWARIAEYSSGDLSVDLFHVYPDHRAYCLASFVTGSDIDTGPNAINSWSFEDGKFYLFYETGRYETFIPQDEYTLKTDGDSPFIYKKIYPRRDI